VITTINYLPDWNSLSEIELEALRMLCGVLG
jgi:hypothetical protein